MISSAEVSILMKVSELAKRNGLRPSEANAVFPDLDDGHFTLRLSEYPNDPEKTGRYGKFLGQLGIAEEDRLAARVGTQYPEIRASELRELEDIVDRALSLAPRSRSL
jgi:hypothetical protein